MPSTQVGYRRQSRWAGGGTNTARLSVLLVGWLTGAGFVSQALEFPGLSPGPARVETRANQAALSNRLLAVEWSTAGDRLRPLRVRSLTGAAIDLAGGELFRLVQRDGSIWNASDFVLAERLSARPLPAARSSSVLSHRSPGQQLRARLVSSDGSVSVDWQAELRDGANAIRQEFAFRVRPESTLALKEVRLVELPASANAQVVGSVPGSPAVAGDLFFAFEHPDATWGAGPAVACSLPVDRPLRGGDGLRLSSAMGAVPAGQLRRGFLYYVERERAHPYRPFLHYNAWYDICWGDRKINEAECLRVIEQFGQQLVRQRQVPLASFVWDDGWDDPKTLWRPIATNFPNAFTPILAAARRYHSTLGFWLSPFGGYGKPAEDRLAMGRAQSFETGPQGFSLAGPKYFERFRETCLGFIDRSGANFFKFDGLARSVQETEAMLRLTEALRARRPDLFISITTGTWPSPFWLWYGDSTWRGGGDMGFHGPGSKREQWITYRDMETYRRVVQGGPLYPINSLMNQGFAHARYGTAAEVGSDDEEIRRELRSLFAGGTCLQELYVTPEKMSPRNWDDLAECARWAQTRAEVLVDTHWVGGDPGNGEVYGWASWSKRRAILALRNPTPQPATITLDVVKAFELPPGAARRYRLKSPWKSDTGKPSITAQAQAPRSFSLAPFEVLVWDAEPLRR